MARREVSFFLFLFVVVVRINKIKQNKFHFFGFFLTKIRKC